MNCVGHQSPGCGRIHGIVVEYKGLEYWTELGVTLERGILTASLLPTSSAITTSTGQQLPCAAPAAQIPVNDLCNSSRDRMATKAIWVLGSRRQRPSSIVIHLPGVSRRGIITPKAASAGTSSLLSRDGAKNIGQGGFAATTTDTRWPRNMSKPLQSVRGQLGGGRHRP